LGLSQRLSALLWKFSYRKRPLRGALAVSRNLPYVLNMNSFAKGMGNFNLFPSPKTSQTEMETAWQQVADAFATTGMNMRRTMSEFDTQIQSAQVNKAHGKPRT
jgi:hypothetical protein